MKKTLILFFGFALLVCAVFAQSATANIKNVPNGTYLGTYELANKSYTYQAVVKVDAGKLVSIKLVKAPSKSAESSAMKAFDTMIKQNSVDAVSGATWKMVVTDALVKQIKYTN